MPFESITNRAGTGQGQLPSPLHTTRSLRLFRWNPPLLHAVCPTSARCYSRIVDRSSGVLASVRKSQIVLRLNGSAFGARAQSIEHDRGARRHSHQIGCGLTKSLAGYRRTLGERRIEARSKRIYRSLCTALKLAIQTGGKGGQLACVARAAVVVLRHHRRAPIACLSVRRRKPAIMAGPALIRLAVGRPTLARSPSVRSVLLMSRPGGARNLWRGRH